MKAIKIMILLLMGISSVYAAHDQSQAKKGVVYNYAAEYTKCISTFAYYYNCSEHRFSDYLTRASCIEDMHRKYGHACFEVQKKYIDSVQAKDAQQNPSTAKK